VQTDSVESWWLDELGHAGGEHLDPAYVKGYDRKAGFDPADDIDALEALGLDADSVVLDLGAGTGTFALAMATRCRHVLAVDVSRAMTDAIRHRVAELGLDNVTVIEAGFLTYEHVGRPVDAIFTRNALHHLPDFWKALALERMASTLRPGGVLRLRDLIFDFSPADVGTRIQDWLSGAVTDPATGWTAEELVDHVRGEFSTFSWLLDEILDRTGFEVTDRAFERSAYGTYTATRR
jgi:cyclopropane fatty-acyl-phospholipid synthase-like methyltransferase